jgi:GPH family glycoside/pentoside/hexuronide:cation symporter
MTTNDPTMSLTTATKIYYGMPNFAGAAMGIAVSIHINIFYSDVVMIPLGFIALAVALARAFDAISDPLMGWVTDRTRTRWGRRRPWIAIGAPLQAAALVALFSPPESFTIPQLSVWFTLCFICYYLTHTILAIPHYALGPELTGDYKERSSLFAWLEGFTLLGVIYASGVPRLVTQRIFGELLGFTIFAIITGVLLIILYWLLVYKLREKPEYSAKPPNPLAPGIRRTMRNRPFRILMVSTLIGSLTAGIPGYLMPFFVIYVLKPPDPQNWVPWMLMVVFISSAVTLPLWLKLANAVGKLRALITARFLAIGTFFSFFLMGEGDIWYYAVFVGLAGAANGATQFLGLAIQADVIDYDELLTGHRREAQYQSLWAIMTKFTMIPSAAVPLAVLAAMGYAPNIDQNETVIFTITALYGLSTAVSSALALVVLLWFPISETMHRSIQAAIKKIKLGETVIDPLTGKEISPHGEREVDEDTGWHLDHFSLRELARAQKRGQGTLVHSTGLAVLLSLGLGLITCWAAVISLGDLSSPPGLTAVLLIVMTGICATALCYHALRLAAARRLTVQPVHETLISKHLATLTT